MAGRGGRDPRLADGPHPPASGPRRAAAEELERLLAACSGTSFEERRDTAIIRLLASTGMRRGECIGLRVEDVDFDHEVALVLGKGRRPRACPFDGRYGNTPRARSTPPLSNPR